MVFHYNGHFDLHRILNDKMGPLYIFNALLMFVKSLIGIFVPIYLFKIGYSFQYILLYLGGMSLMYVLLAPFAIYLINSIGFKKLIVLSFPFYFLQLLSLNFADSSIFFFHLTWIFFGFHITFFWPAMHSEICSNSSSKHRASQLGTLQIITTIFATLAPFIGGLILESYGYFILLVFSMSIMALSSLFLFYLPDIKLKKVNFGYKNYKNIFNVEKYRNSKYVFTNEGFAHLLSLGIWPIILFILLDSNFAVLGSLYTFTSIISVFFILYFKSMIDRKSKKKVLNVTSKSLSVIWFLRALVLTVGGIFIYILESIFKIVIDVFRLSYMSIFYNNAKKTNELEYINVREVYVHLTRAIFCILLIIIFSFIEPNLINLAYVVVCGVAATYSLSMFGEERL